MANPKKPASQLKKDYAAWKEDEKNGGIKGIPFPLLRDYDIYHETHLVPGTGELKNVGINGYEWQKYRDLYGKGKLAYQLRAKEAEQNKAKTIQFPGEKQDPMSPIVQKPSTIKTDGGKIVAGNKNVTLPETTPEQIRIPLPPKGDVAQYGLPTEENAAPDQIRLPLPPSKGGEVIEPPQPPQTRIPYAPNGNPGNVYLPPYTQAPVSDQIRLPLPDKGDPLADYGPPESGEQMQPITPQFPITTNPYIPTQAVNNLPSAVPPASDPHTNLMSKLFPDGVTPSDIYDVGRLGIGLNGALTKVPTYSKSGAWNDYVNRARQMSRQGFSPEEYSLANRNADQAYNGDVYAINNLSGGNAGVALGNLGRAASSLYGSKAMLAARDAELQRQNFQNYGGILGQDNQQNRQIFEDKANQIMESKRAGAQLANDAIYNLKNRGEYNKAYGSKSLHNRYMTSLAEKQELENKNLKLSQQNFGESFAPKTVQTPTVAPPPIDYIPGVTPRNQYMQSLPQPGLNPEQETGAPTDAYGLIQRNNFNNPYYTR